MTAAEFIRQQLSTTGWAPVNYELALFLCPGVVNAHRDFAVDARNPENLLRVFPGTRLYQAKVEGVGAVPVLSRSALILAERMQFLGFAVSSVTEFNDRATAAQPVKPEPRTVDLIALQHSDVATKEAPRTCNECGRLSSTGACMATALGEVEGAPVDYRPAVREPRRCLAFKPPHGAYDDRTGRQLWPEIVAQVEQPKVDDKPEVHEGDSAICKARALLTAMLKDGPRDAAEIFIAAQGDNIHERTVQRAAEALGVVKTKAGFSGGWTWAMPETEGIAQST